MAVSVRSTSVPISASTTSANGAIPTSSAGYFYVVNGTNGIAYINEGTSNSVTATSANPGIAPNSAGFLLRDPLLLGVSGTFIAVLLSTGATSGIVQVTPTGNPLE